MHLLITKYWLYIQNKTKRNKQHVNVISDVA